MYRRVLSTVIILLLLQLPPSHKYAAVSDATVFPTTWYAIQSSGLKNDHSHYAAIGNHQDSITGVRYQNSRMYLQFKLITDWHRITSLELEVYKYYSSISDSNTSLVLRLGEKFIDEQYVDIADRKFQQLRFNLNQLIISQPGGEFEVNLSINSDVDGGIGICSGEATYTICSSIYKPKLNISYATQSPTPSLEHDTSKQFYPGYGSNLVVCQEESCKWKYNLRILQVTFDTEVTISIFENMELVTFTRLGKLTNQYSDTVTLYPGIYEIRVAINGQYIYQFGFDFTLRKPIKNIGIGSSQHKISPQNIDGQFDKALISINDTLPETAYVLVSNVSNYGVAKLDRDLVFSGNAQEGYLPDGEYWLVVKLDEIEISNQIRITIDNTPPHLE